ncbi:MULTISPECIES: ABC transporter substrate-binding protein [Herbaspirillum]|uniref:ABC-type branched-chain amino acid transport system, periplasmic component protein n=1 Tax=Herbaspirillum seropedicae (strain SmR1) TaxID=757424 RepID=D8ISR0_HERSS|nr:MULTISPECIES: ABC transporter substrate-binding protein [Herbaspirillum]ADJ65476.1 ABC-type branched-chain amino acid transport system, periplasmic component protein [Herbaspirillum seropedicae SmR1]AKN67309.1 ABC transporter substrate-binding protein [Herbaspirillum seropedicae]NQE31901.1 ABC transporter substrate-binding protein [Herbaspirillum seropedicae]UMU23316.1 ABC transporter substrate-binding protein [Herbaspirillum seropedicae]
MRFKKIALLAVMAASGGLLASLAQAQETIKVGLIAAFSGPFADYGKQMEGGIKAYMAQHGDQVAGKKIQIIIKDTTGPSPEIAKRLAQELVVREKVDFLAGFGLTPEALAVAPIAEQAKKPMIIMNAATSVITTKSNYIARFSMTLPQVSGPMATWALKNGIKRVVTLVADYGPGIDAETAFKTNLLGGGGQVLESIRVPLRNPEFAPYIQRIKDAKPEAVFIFVPAGEQSIAFMKGYRERGLAEAGIKVIATGDLTDDHVMPAMGESTLGVITTFHYSAAHDSPENKAFLKSFAAANPGAGRPNFMAVAAYDGMNAIYEVSKKLNGKIDGDRAMAILKTMKFTSPRGPIAIDPATRDIVQTVYVRKVEKIGNEAYNVEFDKFENMKDTGK